MATIRKMTNQNNILMLMRNHVRKHRMLVVGGLLTIVLYLTMSQWILPLFLEISHDHHTMMMKTTMGTFTLFSSDFDDGQEIPKRFTCEGEDISPPLFWKNAPVETQSLLLIMEDPDAPDPAAPTQTWLHWVVYNIPGTVSFLEESMQKESVSVPKEGAVSMGKNDWHKKEYGGPCPPIGRHRYFFKLYALDQIWNDDKANDELSSKSSAVLESSSEFKSHILARAELMGTYQKRV